MDEPAPEVLIMDTSRPAGVRLSYDADLGCIQVGLDDPPQIRVTGLVYLGFMRELVDFFGLLSRRFPEGTHGRETMRGLRGGWRVASNDDELCIEAWVAKNGFVELSICLASEMWNPTWIVRVHLSVASADLGKVGESIERLARYADGLPQAPNAEPSGADDLESQEPSQ